jgi:predicted RNA-binding Zn-ribbon protein involved in translation (DUF1610 family)
MSDVHTTEDICPHCGAEAVAYRHCDNLLCEDGLIDDALDNEDEYLLEGVSYSRCPDCRGAGIIHWCQSCGKDVEYPLAEYDDDEYC